MKKVSDQMRNYPVGQATDIMEALDDWADVVEEMENALVAVRQYLEERGIRTKGTIGRTQILPQLDAAISPQHKEVR